MFLQSAILFIVTSHSELGDSGNSTGYYLPEIAHAYYQLNDQFRIVFASPAGGIPPRDPVYETDDITEGFLADTVAMTALNTSTPLAQIQSTDYVAVYFPGGHGPMYDLPNDETSARITQEIYEAGGIVGAVCHGPAGIVNVRLSTGEFLVNGKDVTGFSNEEEDERIAYLPFLLEDQLKVNGGSYTQAPVPFVEHVVVDGTLVTGQNPQSASKVGSEIRRLLTTV